MMDFLYGVLSHTPLWVYVLFIFLLFRGIKSRQPATVTLERLVIIPALFLIWDIYDLLIYRDLSLINAALWIISLLAGAYVGYLLVNPLQLRAGDKRHSIQRPADYSALPFMMLAFCIKYVQGVLTAISPETLRQPMMEAAAIISGGIFAGVFIGKFTRYILFYYQQSEFAE